MSICKVFGGLRESNGRVLAAHWVAVSRIRSDSDGKSPPWGATCLSDF